MHELSMCDAIARTVYRRAGGRQVRAVTVRIGHLRQVVPAAMSFSWQMLTAATELEGSELEIEHVAATVACTACGATSTLDVPVLACASCGSSDVTLQTGEELLLVSIETVDEAAAVGGR